jgi:dihydroflavonol-4-reductase
MGDKVLVTGASGFVGSAVARALGHRGDEVRVLVRSTSSRTNIEGETFEIAEGDMMDRHALLEAMDGVRYVFHVAADYRLWARDPQEIVRNNLEGTRAVMEAARDSGVERVVYTSSVAALKPVQGIAVDETSRHSEATVIGAYKKSKLVAERLVERMAGEGFPVVIVSPSTPIGPRDVKPTPTGRIIVQAANGGMPAYVDTGLNLVHVDDVAQGHLLALDRGRTGQAYILGGEDVRLKDMLAVICPLAGRRPPRVRLPRMPLYPLAWCSEAVARVTGKEPMLTVDALNMSRHHMFFSSTKAETELGYTARPWQRAIEDAVAWFRNAGYIT